MKKPSVKRILTLSAMAFMTVLCSAMFWLSIIGMMPAK